MFGALKSDLGKSAFEGWAGETYLIAGELKHARKHLASWMRPKRVRTPLLAQPGVSKVYAEPLGVVLNIAPWNYPIQLALAPLIGAIAAGNSVVLKPSEVAPACSALLARLLPRYLDPECVAVIEGGVPETTRLLEQRFDHIFYTGNGTVGRIVMEAAARHLTPVTLELGGKSPCIVDEDVDLEVAARRIVWGKFFNAGQTCIAPDYVLCHASREAQLIEQMKKVLIEFYGEDPKASPDYGRIINERHHARLSKLIASGELAAGGQSDPTDKYIAPTVLRKVDPASPVMADEIFGPILPVLTVPDLDAAITFINARDKPLALYLFSRNAEHVERVLQRTSSGGACVNDVMAHLIPHELPFGGVGASGMGAYHGHASFETFTHKKSVMAKATFLDPSIRYPPYTPGKTKWAKRLA